VRRPAHEQGSISLNVLHRTRCDFRHTAADFEHEIKGVASPAGFEPATRCLEGSRSSPLSYGDEPAEYTDGTRSPPAAYGRRTLTTAAVTASATTATAPSTADSPMTKPPYRSPGTW
jgi:hypothetical protein